MSGSQLLLLGGTPQVASDPNFEYTTLLLPGNGTNGAQNNTFLDSSTNNFTITRNGNTTQGTFSPFSQTGWGNYFDGTGDYLTAPSNAAFNIGTGDYTFECWVYKQTSSRVMLVAIASAGLSISISASGNIEVNRSLIAIDFTFTAGVPNNQWTHIAVARSGTSLQAFMNGTSLGTQTSSTSYGQGTCFVGIDADGSSTPYLGYISNLRVVKGTAVYTSNFTPSTTPLTAITNTSLLTCQSNRFRDASTNNFTITRNGDVSVQAFSPFNPTAAWSALTNGGSGYFDGSGDYLTTASSSSLALGSGDFTVDVWFYPTTTNTYFPIDFRTGCTLYFYVTSGTTVNVAIGGNSETTFTGVVTNAWNHFACVRSGSGSNNVSYYLNGVRGAQQTDTTNFSSATTITLGKRYTAFSGNEFYLAGYLGSTRLVVGTAVYSGATYTVPTAPLTAITNTSLLLNYTNAGIYDATSKNDLETVGNAQISTTQSKFGGSSMYFDGSGDRLFEPSNQNYNFGTGDFTIELWAYPTSQGGHGSSNNDCFIDFRPGANGVYGTLYIFNNGTGVYWFVNSANRITGGAISNGTWTHIAIARASGSTKLFINGTQSGSTYADTNNYLVSPIMIGEFNDGTGGGNFQGYIDDLRITKGIARYTAAFTPPTTAFPLL